MKKLGLMLAGLLLSASLSAGQVLFTNVDVFDGVREKRIENASVLVEGNLIKEGAYADLLIVDGNPLEDMMVMTDPETNFRLIMKDGVVYKNTLGG